jgi:type IV pilus assembly protein PilC
MLSNPSYYIEVLEGADRGRNFPLKGKKIVLGRKVSSKPQLDENIDATLLLFEEASVSKTHAVLEWDEKEKTYVILHKSATNATLVNAQEVTRRSLRDDDVIKLGLLTFRYISAYEKQAGQAAQGMPAGTTTRDPGRAGSSPPPAKPKGSGTLRLPAGDNTQDKGTGINKSSPSPPQKSGSEQPGLPAGSINRDAGGTGTEKSSPSARSPHLVKRIEFLAEKPDGTMLLDQIDAESVYEATKLLIGENLKIKFIEVIKENIVPGSENWAEKLWDKLLLQWKRFETTYGLGKKYKRVSEYTLYLFTQQLAVILDSGIPVIRGFQIIQQTEEDRSFKHIIRELGEYISSGSSASQAFGKFPTVFPDYYRALVAIGETTGKLHETLKKQAYDLEKLYSFKKKTTSALTYPAVILLVSLFAVFFIMIYFVPSFMGMFKEMGTKLPLATAILVFMVKYATDPMFWICVAAAIALIFFFLHNYASTPLGKQNMDLVILKVPVVGNLIISVFLYNFFLNLACMLECGVNLMEGLKVLLSTSRNAVFKNFFSIIINQVGIGENLSTVLKGSWLVPRYVVDFILAGEMAGDLPYMLRKAGSLMEEQVTNRLETLLNVFEPLIICGLAFFMGFIMIAVFLPMYSIINSFTQ